MAVKELGIAVVGAGRIGTLRARLAAKHPSVGFLAISDLDPARARALAEQTDADFHCGNNFEVIERPEVNAEVAARGLDALIARLEKETAEIDAGRREPDKPGANKTQAGPT